jgi:hypothetical protein
MIARRCTFTWRWKGLNQGPKTYATVWLAFLFGLTTLIGIGIILAAPTAIPEIAGLLILLIAAVLLSGACIVYEVHNIHEDLGEARQKAAPEPAVTTMTRLGVLLLAPLLAGCATGRLPAPLPQPTAESATLIVVRPSAFTGGGVSWPIALDDLTAR